MTRLMAEKLLKLKARVAELEEENKVLKEVRGRGCQCSDEDACAFVRERNAALAQVAKLKSEVEGWEQDWDERHGGTG